MEMASDSEWYGCSGGSQVSQLIHLDRVLFIDIFLPCDTCLPVWLQVFKKLQKVQSCEFSITVIYRMTAMYQLCKKLFFQNSKATSMPIAWGCQADGMLWYYYCIWFHRSPAALDPWYALPVLFGITTYIKITDSFTPWHLRLWYKTYTSWIAKSSAGHAVLNSPNHWMKFSKAARIARYIHLSSMQEGKLWWSIVQQSTELRMDVSLLCSLDIWDKTIK